MAENIGAISANRLMTDKLLQNKLTADVIKAASGSAVLNNKDVVLTVGDGKDLKWTVPGIDSVSIHADVPEGQKVGITNAEYFGNDVTLTKDSALISFTDEALIRTRARGLDAWGWMAEQAKNKLAHLQDVKIVTQLNTTPQTGTAIDLASGNIYDALAEAESMIEDYAITAIVCSRAARTKIFRNVNSLGYTGSNPASPYNGLKLPGADIPIYASTAVGEIDANALYFVSAEVPGCIWAPGPVQTHTWRDEEGGKLNMRIDAFRAAKSNVMQTNSNTNLGVVKFAWS